MAATDTIIMHKLSDQALLSLLAWLSPNFPVGAFAYSHGLEQAVEAGLVGDGPGLEIWIEGLLCFGSARSEAGLFRQTYEAVAREDVVRFDEALALAASLRGSQELALESSAQGSAFWRTLQAAWPLPDLETWHQRIAAGAHPPSYSVAVATASALAGIPVETALSAFLQAFVANLVSAATRLMPLGQTEAQQIIARLNHAVAATAQQAVRRSAGDVASAAIMVDWLSMKHETQYTRLFRS